MFTQSKARSSEDGSQEPKSSILQHMFTQSIFQDLVYNRLYHLKLSTQYL